MIKKLLGVLLFLSLTFVGKSQLVVDNTLTPQQLVNSVLMGNGVNAFNITYSGGTNTIGRFTATGTNLGMSAGVILKTGDIAGAVGPNDQGGEGTSGSLLGDPDLDMLTTNATDDATILEFDFVPSSDSVSFRYIFASEEYNEYVCSQFNDVFGFFLSGPGISGPYSNNAINIALIPNSTMPVSIGTVNNGNIGANGNAATCTPGGMVNSQYFVDNDASGENWIQFDGFTVVLVASANVICGDTFHIKMAISDVVDASFDSGVFLEAESFSSRGVNITTQTLSGDSVVSEGCTGAGFIFTRVDTTVVDTISMVISGNAIAGIDYDAFPDTIIFPIGVDTIIIPINTIQDNVYEGTDTLITTVSFVTECGNTIIRQGIIYIVDTILITSAPDTFIVQCNTDSFFVTVTPQNGNPPFSYVWATGETNDTIWLHSTQDTFTTVTITDFCGNTSGIDTVYIAFQLLPPLSLNLQSGLLSDTLYCNTDFVIPDAGAAGGLGPITYLWNNGDNSQFPFYFIDTTQYISVSILDQCGVSLSDSILISFLTPPPPVISLIGSDTSLSCPFQTPLLIGANVNYPGTFDYTWSNGSQDFVVDSIASITASQLVSDEYYVSVFECNRTTNSDTISVSITIPPPPIVSISGGQTVNCSGDTLHLNAVVTNGSPSYNYNWAGTNSSIPVPSNGSSVIATISTASQIDVFVTDQCHSTPVQATTVINITPPPPIVISLQDTAVVCPGDSIRLEAQIVSGVGPFTYDWPINPGSNDSIYCQVGGIDTTTYIVFKAKGACGTQATDSLLLTVPIYPAISISSSNDTAICTNDTIYLTSTFAGGAGNYVPSWWLGSDSIVSSNTLNYTNSTSDTLQFIMKVLDGCGNSAEDTIQIEFIPCDIEVTNVMTPNGDGINDYLIFNFAEYFENNKLVVYDRWGIKVFESDNYKNDWNGGKQLEGTYFWVLTPTTTPQGPFKGFVLLLRDK